MTTPTISLGPGGLSVDGDALSFPIPRAQLVGHWGEPDRWVGRGGTVLTWHELGLYAHEAGEDHLKTLCAQFLPEPDGPAFLPSSPFPGTVLVDGSPLAAGVPGAGAGAGRRAHQEDTEVHGVRLHVAHRDDDVEAVEMTSAVPVHPPVPRERYLPRPAPGGALRFTDLNLKLAVVDELMYQQEVLEPRFSLTEFARWYEEGTIDLESEGHQPVAEALAWFEQLEIDRDLAGHVRELVLDAGNEVYRQVAPRWDGEDATFDIGSWEDLALLPRLERLDLISLTPDPLTVRALRERGLTVDT